MNRVYSLLRNNKQSGPHSLDDLKALTLKPFDLIWIEGKSAGWSYPTDIEELKEYVAGINQATQTPDFSEINPPSINNENLFKKITPKKIHVSLPRTLSQQPFSGEKQAPEFNLQQKADELRKKVQEYAAQSFSRENKPQIKYNRSLEAVEEDYTKWVYNHKINKKKSFAKKPLFITALFLTLGAVGYLLIQSFFYSAPQKVQEDEVQQPFSELSIPKELPVETVNLQTEELNTSEKSSQHLVKQNNKTSKIKERKETTTPVHPPLNPSPSKAVDEKKEPAPQNETGVSSPSEEVEIQEPEVATPKEKKKTLAEKIDGFIDKLGKKKQKESVPEDQSATTPSSGERKSTRRDDETAKPAEEVDLTSLIDITANNPDNWMMGVKGLKLTLRNRSNEIIKTAIVELRYYNEQNSLLEKKLIYFTNVAPKKSLTVLAPDHRLADHTDFKLLSVSNKEDAYVRQ